MTGWAQNPNVLTFGVAERPPCAASRDLMGQVDDAVLTAGFALSFPVRIFPEEPIDDAFTFAGMSSYVIQHSFSAGRFGLDTCCEPFGRSRLGSRGAQAGMFITAILPAPNVVGLTAGDIHLDVAPQAGSSDGGLSANDRLGSASVSAILLRRAQRDDRLLASKTDFHGKILW